MDRFSKSPFSHLFCEHDIDDILNNLYTEEGRVECQFKLTPENEDEEVFCMNMIPSTIVRISL